MSYEDLEDHNVFLPEEAWGKTDLSASVNQALLSGVFIIGVTSCVLMWLGHGGTLTWVGAGLFFVFMYAFLWVSNSGIKHQNEDVDQLIKKHDSPR